VAPLMPHGLAICKRAANRYSPPMAAKVSELLEKKFILVTGKGGSGKSLLALSLAHRLSERGKRVWLVELGRKRDKAFTRLPELVGVKSGSHKPMAVRLPKGGARIWLSVLDPTRSLSEYVDMKLPTAGLAGILLNNRVTASFLEVVPGLPDLVSLGKLWHAVTHPDPSIGPDVIVLDAPATGHALSFIRAPENFRRITKVGPIHRDAAEMAKFLKDPGDTGLALTTLPEEMSLQETQEARKGLKDFPSPFLFVNRCFPELPAIADAEKDSIPYKAYAYSRTRAEREREALAGMQGKFTKIPFFFPDPGAPPLYQRMAEVLA
jgi:anion-transporting  ArsA/GET3 family ATPase